MCQHRRSVTPSHRSSRSCHKLPGNKYLHIQEPYQKKNTTVKEFNNSPTRLQEENAWFKVSLIRDHILTGYYPKTHLACEDQRIAPVMDIFWIHHPSGFWSTRRWSASLQVSLVFSWIVDWLGWLFLRAAEQLPPGLIVRQLPQREQTFPTFTQVKTSQASQGVEPV